MITLSGMRMIILGGSMAAVAVWLTAAVGALAAEPGKSIRIDADYPSGNIVAQRIDEDTAFVAPDQRDTQKGQWWFYWSFRVRAAAGQSVNVVFTGKNPIGVRGPAMSEDGGVTWKWLGADAVKSTKIDGKAAWSFAAVMPKEAAEVRYAFCPPYNQSHLQAFLDKHKDSPALRAEELCRSRKGRAVEMVRAGQLNAEKAQGIVLLTSRHHCCETMATYAMEGFLGAVLADDELGRTWRERWQVIAIPFVDKDGVEDGDQGKYRDPHDHNRDYNEKPLYTETAALMKLGAGLKGRVAAMMDLHCPHIRGEWNDRVYIVGAEPAAVWEGQVAFARTLERVQTGPLVFRAKDCLAFGSSWNTAGNTAAGRSAGQWGCAAFPEARLVTTMEIAYADALGKEVNAESARALGRDLAKALAEHLAKQ